MKKILSHTLLIFAVSLLLGFGMNVRLIKQYFRGEFQHGFISSEEYPSISFITLVEAEDLFSFNEALFIDSREEQAFQEGHIVGAVNIPYEDGGDTRLLAELSIPKEKPLVVYCDGSECQSSIALARRLHEEGFTAIKVFFGGWEEWLKQGLPITTRND
ncbi:MAG: rhodanese-like domain-containing protein [Candidatus Aminicenantes bacterium]|jgi:rhodanese-related sulfurtransferase